MTKRATELATNLKRVQQQIIQAAEMSQRDPSEVNLIVVTKFFPSSDVEILADLGVTDFAENRYQELQTKVPASASLGLNWHFIGGIQTNKAAAIARLADVVHSVSRSVEIAKLNQAKSPTKCLIQLDLQAGAAANRNGAAADTILELADQIAQADNLTLAGLMCVPPLDWDAETGFIQAAVESQKLQHRYPSASWLSIGMSQDLAIAIKTGATHVRIGSAILGSRPQTG